MEPAATPFGGTDPWSRGSVPCILPVFQIHMPSLVAPLLPPSLFSLLLRLLVRPHLPFPGASRVEKRRSSWLGSFPSLPPEKKLPGRPSLPSVVNVTTQGETGAEKGSGRLDPTGGIQWVILAMEKILPRLHEGGFGPCQGIQPTSFHPTWEEQASK